LRRPRLALTMPGAWATTHPSRYWREGARLEPHTHDAWSYWQPAHPRGGDTEARLQMRLATCDALNLPPRDPRFWKPEREANWQNSSPLWSRFIPEYGIQDTMACIGQSEEHVRRPTLGKPNRRDGNDFVSVRNRSGRRTTPLISYNSIGWNRRDYEPIPDNSRPQTSRDMTMWSKQQQERDRMSMPSSHPTSLESSAVFDASGKKMLSSRTATARTSPNTSEYNEGYMEGSGTGKYDMDLYEPPRISGVDTSARPPLVVHSATKVYRPPWIGISY